MRFFRKKLFIALFAVVLAVALALVLATPVSKKSEASYGTPLVVAIIKYTSKVIASQISSAFGSLIRSFFKIYTDYIVKFYEKLWEKTAIEEIIADIGNIGSKGGFIQSKVDTHYDTQVLLDRLKDKNTSRISEGECRITAASKVSSFSDVSAREYRAHLRETLRKEQGFTTGSLYAQGPIVANRKLREKRLEKFCSKDEELGNVSSLCGNTNPENVNKDRALHMLTECNTIRKQDEEAMLQMLAYVAPPPGNMPLPKALKDDIAVQDAYLARAHIAIRREPFQAFIADKLAYHMEPERCDVVPGLGTTPKDFVNAIDARLNRPVDPNRPCPSQAEIKCYVNKYMLQDPKFIEDCNLGAEQVKRCKLMLDALRVETTYEAELRRNKELLMNVVQQSDGISQMSPPVDSIGREYNSSSPLPPPSNGTFDLYVNGQSSDITVASGTQVDVLAHVSNFEQCSLLSTNSSNIVLGGGFWFGTIGSGSYLRYLTLENTDFFQEGTVDFSITCPTGGETISRRVTVQKYEEDCNSIPLFPAILDRTFETLDQWGRNSPVHNPASNPSGITRNWGQRFRTDVPGREHPLVTEGHYYALEFIPDQSEGSVIWSTHSDVRPTGDWQVRISKCPGDFRTKEQAHQALSACTCSTNEQTSHTSCGISGGNPNAAGKCPIVPGERYYLNVLLGVCPHGRCAPGFQFFPQ